MPVLVDHTPAKLLGDLAQNAGNFATGQAASADARSWQQVDNQYAEAQQAHDIERQQLAQQAQIRERELQQQEHWHDAQTANQAAAIGQRAYANASGTQFKYDKMNADGTYRDDALGVKAGHYADQAGHYQDEADHWDNQDATSAARQQSTDAYRQRLGDIADRRVRAYEQQIASRATGGDPNASFLLRQQMEQRVGRNQTVQQHRAYLASLFAEEQHLRDRLDPNNPASRNMSPEDQKAATDRLGAVRKLQTRVAAEYQNLMLSPQPVAPHPGPHGRDDGTTGAPDLSRGPLDATGIPAQQIPAGGYSGPAAWGGGGAPSYGQIAATMAGVTPPGGGVGYDPGMSPQWARSGYARAADPGFAPAFARQGPDMDPGMSSFATGAPPAWSNVVRGAAGLARRGGATGGGGVGSTYGLPPSAEQAMHQMIGAGYSDDQIKGVLRDQFGIDE